MLRQEFEDRGIEELDLDDVEVIIGVEEFEVVRPQPGIVASAVAQLVSNCLLPMISKLVQDTVVVMHDGMLMVDVLLELDTDELEVIPQPVDGKNEVAQAVS